MLARDLTISTFFLRVRGSALTAFRRLLDFVILWQFLVLQDGCGDGAGCEDSFVEHCKDYVRDVDGDFDIEASISSLFLLRYTGLATLCFFNSSAFLMGSITFVLRR